MNLKNRMIMEEYREKKADFMELGDVVSTLLKEKLKEQNIEAMAVEHRVKAEKSLAGKLELKGDKYASLSDITDILGARIICYFADDVDNIAKIAEDNFEIDWENSVDKRAVLKPDSFGYLSLHYICSIKKGGKYPDNICDKKFEIQIRSILQHTWAAINHDLGYKSDFGVPNTIRRDFSRIAGLLEVADKEFIEVRNNIHNYSDDIKKRIANNTADEITIDMLSLSEYVHKNTKMREFLNEIASLCNAEISEISPEVYIEQLLWLNKKTLGDLRIMLEENHDLAFNLAKNTLSHTDLDILSSSVGLRYLCRAELLSKNYSEDKIKEFLVLSTGSKERAERGTKRLLESYKKVQA